MDEYDCFPTFIDTVTGITSGVTIPESTVTLNDVLAMLNFASLAVHVTTVVPREKNDPDGGSQSGPNITPTLSLTIGVLYVAFAPFADVAFTVMLLGVVNVGGKLSPVACVLTTVTVNESLPVFPASSVIIHITSVVPTGNIEPDIGAQTGIADIAALSETGGNG